MFFNDVFSLRDCLPTRFLIAFVVYSFLIPTCSARSEEFDFTVRQPDAVKSESVAPPPSGANDCDKAGKLFRNGQAIGDGSHREAEFYLEAIGLCPEFYQAHNRLGEIYKNDGKFYLAEKHFALASADASFAEPLNNLGEIYRERGAYILAAEAFRKALEIDPHFRRAQNNLKYVEKRLRKYDFYLSNPFQLLPPPIFSQVGGTTLVRGTTLVNVKYGKWSQHAGIDAASVSIDGQRKYEPVSRETQVDIETWILALQYGLTDRLTLGVMPKFLRKKSRISAPEQDVYVESNVSGIGDTTFMTRLHLWGKRKSHLSLINFLTVPTGDENASDDSSEFANNVPLGAGGWGFAPGFAATAKKDPATAHLGVLYTFPISDIPARLDADLAVSLMIFKGFAFVAELNYEWVEGTERIQTVKADESPTSVDKREVAVFWPSGSSLLAATGLQAYLPEGFRLEIGWQFPIKGDKYDGPRFRLVASKYF